MIDQAEESHRQKRRRRTPPCVRRDMTFPGPLIACARCFFQGNKTVTIDQTPDRNFGRAMGKTLLMDRLEMHGM